MDVSQGERFLSDALHSLSTQTYRDFEIVLCAHGANVRTTDIIRAWEQREPRLRVLWYDRMPLSRAHNRAAEAARGHLFARLDADDVAAPHRLDRQVAAMTANRRLSFVGSAARVIDARGRHLGIVRNPLTSAEIAEALAHSCPILHSSVMICARAFRSVGGYRPGLNICEDYDLYVRLIEAHEAANIAEPLVHYRIHSESISACKAKRMAIAGLCVRAAVIAQRDCLPAPFSGGVPSLRRAQPLVGLSRREVRVRVNAVALQSKFSRRVLGRPTLAGFNIGLRRAALKLGLRPAYSLAFRVCVQAATAIRAMRRPARAK
jgi:hypothetical protein